MATPVYWVGQDGNIYYGSGQQGAPVQNLGKPASGPGQTGGGQYQLGPNGLYDVFTDSGTPKLTFQAQQIQDPALAGSGTFTGGGGGSSGPSIDPAVLAFLGGQINNVNQALGQLDTQKATGIQNVDSQVQQALDRENLNFDQGTRDYNTNKNNTVQDMLQAKENIDTGVRQNTNALQRLLGLAGSGSSSAALIAAPYATSRVGNIQRSGVQKTYGRNLSSLDTGYGDFTNKHSMNVGDINANKVNQENAVSSGIESNRQSLLGQLASLTSQKDQAAGKTLAQAQSDIQPYIDQINAALGRITGLQHLAVNLSTPSAYQAPSLDQYNFDHSKAPTTPNTTGSGGPSVSYADQISPYVINAQNPDQNKQKNVLLA